MTKAIVDILTERVKQQRNGYTAQHDDEHIHGEIANVAAIYAMPPECRGYEVHMPPRGGGECGYTTEVEAMLNTSGWDINVGVRREELVKAAALLIAEIERLDRIIE